ncbi:C2H2 type zinc-finger-domain-containing protein, partial [Truncatella angustata]
MICTTTTSGSSSASTSSSSQPSFMGETAFFPERCLFCNKNSDDFQINMLHMKTAHGLFIPDKDNLLVELEVLIEYLHLVIHGYNECICCGTQRNSTLAVQQHMVGKSHCRFDIAGEESEFADFWDLSRAESGSDDSDEEESTTKEGGRRKGPGDAIHLDGDSLRLPSGKLVSKHSISQQYQRRAEAQKHKAAIEGRRETTTQPKDPTSSTALIASSTGGHKRPTKSEKREQAFTTQLSRLSDNDRKSLMHLPASEQRSVLSTQKKQEEKVKRAERRYQSRVEGLGNKTLQAHFRPD